MDPFSPMKHCKSEIYSSKLKSYQIGRKDNKTLLEIFPAEVWMQILNFLRFNNVHNILESSNFFNKILHSAKTQYLFEPVLKSLLKYLPDHRTTGKILLTYRKVCHMWKKSVDQIVQDKSHHCNIETAKRQIFPKTPKYLDYYIEFTYQFQYLEDVVLFGNHFQNTHLSKNKNPFVARFVEVRYSLNGRVPDFFPELEQLFKKCGHHIFYLHLYIQVSVDHAGLSECHQLFRLMPNLKVLTIYTGNDFCFDQRPEALQIPPFPVLPGVECIKVYGNLSITEKVFERVIQTNRRVKSVQRMKRMNNGEDLLYTQPMPNLEQIRIGFTNMADIRALSGDNVNWPLRKLVADLTFNNAMQTGENMKFCLNVIKQKFGNTLRELHLFLPELLTNHKITEMLNFNSLTFLTLDLPSYPYPLDTVLPYSLKVLEVRLNFKLMRIEKCVNVKDLKAFKKANKLLKQNVWQLFLKIEEMGLCKYSIYGNGKLLERENWKPDSL